MHSRGGIRYAWRKLARKYQAPALVSGVVLLVMAVVALVMWVLGRAPTP